MGFLPGNVVPHLFDLREAEGEDAIPVLPAEILQGLVSFLNPERGPRLTSLTISAG